jgi:hypothetical protein
MVEARSGRCGIAVVPEAGAEAVEGLTFSLSLFAMLAWIVGWGLLIAWSNTFGMMLEGLANALRINAWRIHIDPAAKLREIDHAVVGVLQGYIAASDHAIGFWFHQSARLQGWITDETVKLAQDTLHLGQWLVHSYVPSVVHDATHLLGRATHTLTHTVTRVERVVVHTPAVAKAAAHAAVAPLYRTVAIPHLGELQWIHHHWKALTRAAAAAGSIALAPGLAIPRVWHGIDELRHSRVISNQRLRRLEGLLGATAMAAAMANVLGLRNPNCLRKGPLGKVSRALCGLSANALNDVLGLLVDVLVISEICEVIPLMEQGFNVIAEPLAGLIGEAGAALCGGDFDAPPELAIRALSLPALVGVTAVEV